MLQNSVKIDISRYSDHWQRYQIKSAGEKGCEGNFAMLPLS